jgi:DNA-binding HxlR family transcriptional regulator
MALPRDYSGQACSVARSLEIVGERWTLLIVRDAFYGVRRFTDFARHLDIPRAVLTERLGSLVEHGLFSRVPGPGGRDQYILTDKGLDLWPVVRSLVAWGDEYYAPEGPRRLMQHAACGTGLDANGACPTCGVIPAPADVIIAPGPGLAGIEYHDPITAMLAEPHRLLEPLVPAGS